MAYIDRKEHEWLGPAARNRLSIFEARWLILALTVFLCASPGWSQKVDAAATKSLSATQVVEGMQRHDELQASSLRHYQALRHYSIVYHGFTRTITASMDVEVNYDSSSGKNFRIIAQKGSGALCEKVIKRALESEKEASLNKSTTALNSANYRFELVGMDQVGDRPAYILMVDPITPSKFLYKGKLWVDAADFAVTKMEVQPAKNPSFWISRTLIHHTNQITNGVWLPEQNQSETKVRIGGTAVMTIDYGKYQITLQPGSLQSSSQVDSHSLRLE